MTQEGNSTSSVRDMAEKACGTTAALRLATEEQRQAAIRAIADALVTREKEILQANEADCEAGRSQGLSRALLDRLLLTPARLASLRTSLLKIAIEPAIVGKIEDSQTRPDGLIIQRQRIPLGLIGVIFESRPNVLIDCAALAIKSGNALLLKGGHDAARSNLILGELVRDSIAPYLPRESMQIIPSGDRNLSVEMVRLAGLIDLVIPRGGEGLIRMVQEHARVPVIAHAKGLCHLYIHKDADLDMALALTLNAKVQRPGVCNAIESLLIHADINETFLPKLLEVLTSAKVEVRGESRLYHKFKDLDMREASDEDWDTEYLDLILSVKQVADEQEAIEHIRRHGSHHTEGIVAKDPEVIRLFQTAVDASCLTVNASTRFNDGGELGLGAEIGISTSKLHAYGPMGARELTTLRYLVSGYGHCRT